MPDQSFTSCPKCGKENPSQHVFCGICGSRLDVTASNPGLTLDDLTEAKFLERAMAGKFRIEKELGRGGFGVVFRAQDLLLDRTVAIKALHLTKSGDQQLVRRFIKEARLSAKLEHPNIVRIYTIDSAGLIHYFIMEFVDGPTIKDYLNERGVFSPYDTVKYAKDILNALAFAHDHGIVHRDIKPANVILKREEFAVVTDFGIAKALWSDATALTTGVIGTPIYMAPELFRGEDSDGRMDQYSCGVMLFEMLTGEPPFVAQGTLLIQQHIAGQIPSIRQRNPDVPVEIEEIVTRMLRKKREDRFKDCHAILEALDALDVSQLPRETDVLTQSVTLADFSLGNLVERAQAALVDKEYEKALEFMNAAHILSPDNLDIQVQLEQIRLRKESEQKVEDLVREGIARFHEGRFTQAISSWELALALDKTHSDIPKYIDQAQKLKIAADRGEALKAEGLRALNQQRFETAVQKFEAARELLTNDSELPDLIERAQVAGRDAEEVRDLLDKAEEYRVNFRFDEAIEIYRRVLKLDPERVTAKQFLEKAIQDQKTYAEFLTLENKWRRMAEQGQFHAALAEIESAIPAFHEFQGAIRKLIGEIKRDQDKQATIVRLAALAKDFEEKGKTAEAEDVWNKIQSVEPNHPVLTGRRSAARPPVAPQSEPPSKPSGAPAPAAAAQPPPSLSSPQTPSASKSPTGFRIGLGIFGIVIVAGGVLWSLKPDVFSHTNPALLPTMPATVSPTSIPIQSAVPEATRTLPAPTVPAVVETALPVEPTIMPSVTPADTATQLPDTPTLEPRVTVAVQPTRSPTPRATATPKPTQMSTSDSEADDSDGFSGMDMPRAIRHIEKLVAEKKYRRAMRGIMSVLTKEPRNETALQLRLEVSDILERSNGLAEVARRMIAQNDNREARDIITKLAELDPFHPALKELRRSVGDSSGNP